MAKLALGKIGQINVPVKDVGRATAFYREKLGLPFLFEAPNMAFFDCAGVRLLLEVPQDPAFDHPSSIIYFLVEDINGRWDELMAGDVEGAAGPALIAKMPDHDLWMAFFKDPEGNTLALMEEVR
jgi:predicted enzyme related to lactoylglutathione lyase